MDDRELLTEVRALRVALEKGQFQPRAEAELRFDGVLREVGVLRSEVQAEVDDLRDDLKRMQEWQVWAVRLIVATMVTVLISAVLGAVLKLG